MSDEGERFGWYAHPPAGFAEGDDTDDPVRSVRLWDGDPEIGPFWEGGVFISDDFDELHEWIGISRELFDDATAWCRESASLRAEPSADWKRRHFERQQDLLRRLSSEVHPGIEVEAPRREPRTLVQLSRLNADATSGDLVLSDEHAADAGEPKALPTTLDALRNRVLAWVADAGKYQVATAENNAAIFAWEDEGFAIARELQQVLGDDYRVVAR